MTEDSFGFSSARRSTAEKLRAIKPTQGPHPASLERVDAAGEALDFTSREQQQAQPTFVRRRRRLVRLSLSTRAHRNVWRCRLCGSAKRIDTRTGRELKSS